MHGRGLVGGEADGVARGHANDVILVVEQGGAHGIGHDVVEEPARGEGTFFVEAGELAFASALVLVGVVADDGALGEDEARVGDDDVLRLGVVEDGGSREEVEVAGLEPYLWCLRTFLSFGLARDDPDDRRVSRTRPAARN